MNKLLGITAMLCSSLVLAETLTVPINSARGEALGSIRFEDSIYGLLITPELKGLPEGAHGFHIHEHPDCHDHGMSAGGHFDPAKTNTHQGPYGQGHLGDLPVLIVNPQGEAKTPTLAPRLKVTDIKGHAVMIHAGGDTYSDTPALGGGGDRVACGVVEAK